MLVRACSFLSLHPHYVYRTTFFLIRTLLHHHRGTDPLPSPLPTHPSSMIVLHSPRSPPTFSPTRRPSSQPLTHPQQLLDPASMKRYPLPAPTQTAKPTQIEKREKREKERARKRHQEQASSTLPPNNKRLPPNNKRLPPNNKRLHARQELRQESLEPNNNCTRMKEPNNCTTKKEPKTTT